MRQATRRVAVLALALAESSQAQERFSTLWDHNGSIVRMSADGPSRSIVYETVRTELLKIDVSSGTVLFRGERVGDRFVGEAYTFKLGCSPASYRVSGRIEGGRRLVLVGRAPVYGDGACEVVGYSGRSSHARLVFTLTRGAKPD